MWHLVIKHVNIIKMKAGIYLLVDIKYEPGYVKKFRMVHLAMIYNMLFQLFLLKVKTT